MILRLCGLHCAASEAHPALRLCAFRAFAFWSVHLCAGRCDPPL